MKGLKKWPTIKDLEFAYLSLQLEKSVSAEEIARYSQWTRLDPRLAEILTGYISRNWKEISPITLNLEMKKQPWPAVMGVITEQIEKFSETKADDRDLLKNWSQCVMTSIHPAYNEQFFIGLRNFGGKQMKNDVSQSTKSFIHWGYFGKEVFKNKGASPNRTDIPKATRLEILKKLANERKEFSVNDYLEKLGNLVSRRQAERDLAASSFIKKSGFTRNRVYAWWASAAKKAIKEGSIGTIASEKLLEQIIKRKR